MKGLEGKEAGEQGRLGLEGCAVCMEGGGTCS